MRPSRLGPWLEIFATLPADEPVLEVPTARTFFAVAGAETCEAPWAPRSPTENKGKTVVFSLTRRSTERESAVYCP